MTPGKTIALTRRTFVGKVMFLLFNMLPRLVITFLPRSKRLLISWLQSPSAVIWEPQKIKSDTVSTVSPSICHEVMGLDAMILVFWIYIRREIHTHMWVGQRWMHGSTCACNTFAYPLMQLSNFVWWTWTACVCSVVSDSLQPHGL